ncbi:RidA family protein [Dictyobacter formicarum]|uniref:Enamine deaminase RidA n=1 Tax=Dictyobacter formicarum TaxID=2778368 RepID=A0ABQ3VSJ2_9CHLR|nr:RidA family protein [Dictyobacter formicarum]GHO88301.1 enamine deaminase RidA [Dictyobacter formicarum]
MSDQSTQTHFINPSTLPGTAGYSHVVEVTGGRTIFISGQVAINPSGEIVGRNDFRAQTQQVFENIKTALVAVGADFTHVIKLNMYVVDISQVPILREVRDRYVNTQNPPASTLVEIRRLVREELLIEIEAVAHLPE